MTLGAGEREPAPVGFDLCYAMQSNRETAQMKVWDETAQGCFCIGVRRPLA